MLDKRLMVEKSKPVYPGSQPTKKMQKKKKEQDGEPMGRMYKKTKAERGAKFLQKQKTKTKSKPKPKGKKKGKR
jgi:hypothetical protein